MSRVANPAAPINSEVHVLAGKTDLGAPSRPAAPASPSAKAS